MDSDTGDVRQCAVCGLEAARDQFLVTERWTGAEVEAGGIREEYMQRAEADGEGGHVFYFCRWRHLGDFLAEATVVPSDQPGGRGRS